MSRLRNIKLVTWKRYAQLAVVLLCALALKLYYSSASANELGWMLAPTTALVQLVSGVSFTFESHAGYLSGDRSFLIAASCAGVNFLITSFLMLALRKWWRDRSSDSPRHLGWSFITLAALFAYLTTLVANTARISIALWLRRVPLGIGGLSPNQLHRFEGIFVYFGFLLLLSVVSERLSSKGASQLPLAAGSWRGESGFPPHAGRPRRGPGLLRRSFFPLVIYYVTALGIPLANSVYHQGTAATDFWEHSLFVLLTPLLLVLMLAVFQLYQSRRSLLSAGSAATIRTRSRRPWPLNPSERANTSSPLDHSRRREPVTPNSPATPPRARLVESPQAFLHLAERGAYRQPDVSS